MLNLLPVLVGLTGAIIFAATKFKRRGLLRIYMCFIIFIFPFFLMGIKFSIDNAVKHHINLFDRWNFTVDVLLTLMLMACSCTGLWLLSKNRVPKLKYITIGTEAFSEFSPAPASLRLVNRLADVLVIIYVLYFDVIDNYWLRRSLRGTGTFELFLIEFAITLYYYLVLEGIFNTSIGKIITSTMVVDYDGRKPGFGQILGRTLCRYIPFDALSFLGKNSRGWHDSIPNTYVVKAVKENILP
jgi:uncharacterized RDD family membrane protein YckC